MVPLINIMLGEIVFGGVGFAGEVGHGFERGIPARLERVVQLLAVGIGDNRRIALAQRKRQAEIVRMVGDDQEIERVA